jgi:hypothetical protein
MVTTADSSTVEGRATKGRAIVVGRSEGLHFGFKAGLRISGATGDTIVTFASAIIVTGLKMDYKNCCSK